MVSWTCDGLTVSYARGRMGCRKCKGPLPTGALRFGMIFKSPALSNLLFQGFHLHCVEPPSDLTSSSQLEGIEDILPSDVDVIKRWIDGAAKSGKGST